MLRFFTGIWQSGDFLHISTAAAYVSDWCLLDMMSYVIFFNTFGVKSQSAVFRRLLEGKAAMTVLQRRTKDLESVVASQSCNNS